MDLKIVSKCFIEQGSDLVVDSAGNRIPANSVIFCKKRACIIIKDGDISKFSGEEMDVIYQAADEDFNVFEAQVRELDAEINQSILTGFFRTTTGIRCMTRRRQVTGIPPMPLPPGVASPTIIPSMPTTHGMPVTIMTPAQEALAATAVLDTPAMVEQELSLPETILPVDPATNESQLGASYLNNHTYKVIPNTNVSMCSSDSYAQENLKSFLNEKLNDKIYSTFKEMFSNTNSDSVSELYPYLHSYNKEIAKFIQEINIKYGIILDCTVLEISEGLHWAETFQMLARSNIQSEVQTTQVPVSSPAEVSNFSVLLPPVNADLSHQQPGINRLMQVAQQWSAEGLCQYNQAPGNYDQYRFSTNTGRGRSIHPHSTPNMSQVPHNRMTRLIS